MKEQITQDIQRLSLHDSHLEKIVRTQDKLILTIDWAKLENYNEIGLQEDIILGRCNLTFEGFTNERLILDFTGSPDDKALGQKEISFDLQLFKDWLVLENKIIEKDQYCLSGLLDYKEKCGWLEWFFSFNSFRLTWNNFITWTEWNNGKLVEE